jgi:hypothetical protein
MGEVMVEKHEIGIPELYGEVRLIGDKLTEYINRQDVSSTSLTHRVAELEKDLAEVKACQQSDKAQRAQTSRQLWMATLTAFFFPLILLGIGLVIAR